MQTKILIVEDDDIIRKTYADELRYENFSVLEAADGKQGLELALKEKPMLILLDILMPVMDGLAMLKELRKDAWGKNAYVILLTNLSNASEVSEALNNQVTDYLIKSDWNIGEVVKKIEEKLKQ